MRLDLSNALADRVGDQGVTEAELAAVADDVADVHDRIRERRDEPGPYGFMALPETVDADRIERVAGDLADRTEHLVHVGIGGSALGAATLVEVLAPDAPVTVIDNVDPAVVDAVTDRLEPAKTALHVVSKSGTTAETVANALVFRDWLADAGVDPDDRTVVTTGEDSALGDVVKDPAATFRFPGTVPGRYSALSPTGLVTAAYAGVDVAAVLAGGRRAAERCGRRGLRDNPAYALAAVSHLLADRGKDVHVVMPYADGLERFADWTAQLLAESLGKRRSVDGDVVEAGQTPLPAMGVTDQHSLLQLFVEGPNDKQFVVLDVDSGDAAGPDEPGAGHTEEGDGGSDAGGGPDGVTIPEHEAFPYLGGHGLAELRAAECDATVASLVDADRPVARIGLDGVTPAGVGELLYTEEVAVAVLCELAGVDPFDQPGVEAGKRATYGLLGREGYGGDTDTVKAVREPLFVVDD